MKILLASDSLRASSVHQATDAPLAWLELSSNCGTITRIENPI